LNTATLVAGITPMAIAVVALVIRARVLTLDRRWKRRLRISAAQGW